MKVWWKKLIRIFKNKKLFGRVNIIDILIIILLCLVGIVAYSLLRGDTLSLNTTNQREYNFTIQLQRVDESIFDKINVGDKIYDNENNTYVGEVVSKEEGKFKEIIGNHKENKYVYTENDKYININLILKNNLQDKGNNLVTSEEYKIKVGKQAYIRGNNYAGSGYIILIER